MYWVPENYGGGSWIAPLFFVGVLLVILELDDLLKWWWSDRGRR
jgi:hypothetical protein